MCPLSNRRSDTSLSTASWPRGPTVDLQSFLRATGGRCALRVGPYLLVVGQEVEDEETAAMLLATTAASTTSACKYFQHLLRCTVEVPSAPQPAVVDAKQSPLSFGDWGRPELVRLKFLLSAEAPEL